MDSLKNTITSLYVTGIHVGTNEQYIHKIFTKLGRVYKIKYYQGTTTAHVHMKCWWNKTEHIKSFADKIETGVTVPVVYNLIYYWNIGLFNPNSKIGKTNKNIEIQELLEFTKKFGININPTSSSSLIQDNVNNSILYKDPHCITSN